MEKIVDLSIEEDLNYLSSEAGNRELLRKMHTFKTEVSCSTALTGKRQNSEFLPMEFVTAIDTITRRLTDDLIGEILDAVPSEWYPRDDEKSELRAFIRARRDRITILLKRELPIIGDWLSIPDEVEE